MVKVITYGTYDLLHYGHIRLLERAKALGDYLIVGVTSDDYDKKRGKINLQQSLIERVEAIQATGLADEIVVEEYEGQKIDDIKKFDIDIFAIGSDWKGYFDYLSEYCQVIYLPRTEGVSSSRIRENNRFVKVGLIGDSKFLNKVWKEAKSVNGISIEALCTNKISAIEKDAVQEICCISDNIEEVIDEVDAFYIRSLPENHYEQIKKLLISGKHVLCESPITLNKLQTQELLDLAEEKDLILMEAIKTAYSTAYTRLLLLLKTGIIGDVVSVSAVCTSLRKSDIGEWKCIHEWGPTALLPIFQVLGTDCKRIGIISRINNSGEDSFTQMDCVFEKAVGSIRIGDGVKSEGELIISGTSGYVYVPAPWWNTDYFEIRYEDATRNKRYFYQLDGEGIRYELVAFARAVARRNNDGNIRKDVSIKISEVMEMFDERINMDII